MKRSEAVLVSLLVGLVAVRGAAAQAASRAVVGAGASLMQFDLNSDQASRGIVVRGGYAPAWLIDLEAVAEYWPDLGFYRAGSLALEATMYPAGRSRVAPFIAFGAGYFSATDRLGVGVGAAQGVTKTFAVGVAGRVWGPVGLRLDGLMRFDPHSFDDELRLMLTSSPDVRRPAGLPAGTSQLALYTLTPVSGPWHVVEPGVGLAFTTPLGERSDATLDVLLVHWHTEENASFSGWDTRAVVALPAIALVRAAGTSRFRLGIGPAGTLMFEGPDDGLRGGAHVDAGVTFALGSAFVASVTGSLLWLVRSERPDLVASSQLSPADERALLLRFGIGR